MCSATAIGHQLETLHDGLTVFVDGSGRRMPLTTTRIAIEADAGLAVVTAERVFKNEEDVPIEAVLTMPVGFECVVIDLTAEIDGQLLKATSQPRNQARETYEEAIVEGKLSILHEEALRGIHVLSVANLAPGKGAVVTLQYVCPLTIRQGQPFLRLPMTTGQLYGVSPLAPADDLVSSPDTVHRGTISFSTEVGNGRLTDGEVLVAGQELEITVDHAIEIIVDGGVFGARRGKGARGQDVTLETRPIVASDGVHDLAILVDHSGSTASHFADDKTVWSAIRDGLAVALKDLSEKDRVSLWQFASTCQHIGEATGVGAGELVQGLDKPAGGTELGSALDLAIGAGATDILVLTDGQTWESTVTGHMSSPARISAVLVGKDSLDANIGHLCNMTGGQLFYAAGRDVGASLADALAILRSPGTPVKGQIKDGQPQELVCTRGGVEISVAWSDKHQSEALDAIGKYAAALAMPLLPVEAAEKFAVEHGLCSHLTSLVLVDENSIPVEGLPEMRKIPLSREQRLQSRTIRFGIASPRFSIAAPVEQSVLPDSQAYPITRERIREIEAQALRRLKHPSRRDGVQRFSLMPMNDGDPRAELIKLSVSLDWSQDQERRLRSGEDDRLRSVADAMIAEKAFQDLAKDLQKDPLILFLAILALLSMSSARNRERFLTRILPSENERSYVLSRLREMWQP